MPRQSSGFTVIEALIIAAMIGIIAMIAIPAFCRASQKSDIVCYSGGTKIFSANNVTVTPGDNKFYVDGAVVKGECVVTPVGR